MNLDDHHRRRLQLVPVICKYSAVHSRGEKCICSDDEVIYVPPGLIQEARHDMNKRQVLVSYIAPEVGNRVLSAGPLLCCGRNGCQSTATGFMNRAYPFFSKPDTTNDHGSLLRVNLFMLAVCEKPHCQTLAAQMIQSATKNEETNVVCASCDKHESEKEKFSACTRCKVTYYCSKECQRKDWKEGDHKQACIPPPEGFDP